MSAKVFISCGQVCPEEKQVAQSLAMWLTSQGYHPYVAIQIQSFLDLNSGIIGELKTSDYYIFVNFRRDKISEEFFRGSLFTNQELAIAYALDFEHMLLLTQKGIKPEGMFKYMVSNIPEFTDSSEVIGLLQNALAVANWQPDYTRHLGIAFHQFTLNPILYRDHTGERNIRALQVSIRNSRRDLGAIGTILRLFNITDPNGNVIGSPDRSQLKASGHPGYSQTIWPNSEGTFGLLAIDLCHQTNVYLLSELDVQPREPIITRTGRWLLDYEVFSQGFPRLAFRVDLDLTESQCTTKALITKL